MINKVLNSKNLFINTMIALAIGVILGTIAPNFTQSIEVLGALYVNLLKMIVLPLVLAAVIGSITSLGSPSPLRTLGLQSLFWYMVTSSLAVGLAVMLSSTLNLGASYGGGIEVSYDASQKVQNLSISSLFLSFVPKNIFAALTNFAMAKVVIFAIAFGLGALFVDDKHRIFIQRGAEAVNKVMMNIGNFIIIYLTPFGLIGLIGKAVRQSGLAVFEALWFYFLVVLCALVGFVFIIHSILLRFVVKESLLEHYRVAKKQLIIAFSTASSVATIPQTLKAAEELRVQEKIRNFTLPLGATVNMSGTAMYVIFASCFIAQITGAEFVFFDYVVMGLMVIILSIGISGTPGASLMALILVLDYFGIPLEYISIVLVTDRILDQVRTAVNVHDDLVISRILSKKTRFD